MQVTSNRYVRPLLGFALILAVWAIASATELVRSTILPSPHDVVHALSDEVSTGGLLTDAAVTIRRVAVALILAIGLGVALGLFLGYQKSIYAWIEPPIHALRSVPASALFPLLLLIVGIGEGAIIALAAYPSLLVILVNTVAGVRLADQRRLYQARLLSLGPVRTVTDILFYEALPNTLDGIRTAISYSLVLVVAVEMFIGVGDTGLGRRIYDYQATYRVPETWAAIVLAGGLGVMLNGLVSLVEARLLHWRPDGPGRERR